MHGTGYIVNQYTCRYKSHLYKYLSHPILALHTHLLLIYFPRCEGTPSLLLVSSHGITDCCNIAAPNFRLFIFTLFRHTGSDFLRIVEF